MNKLSKAVILLFLAVFIAGFGCGKEISHKSRTSIILQDFVTLDIEIKFFFNDEKERREFRFKEQEILFALRLSLKQHKSSMLKRKGRNNVNNTIIAICKRRLNKRFSRIKITEYKFSENKST